MVENLERSDHQASGFDRREFVQQLGGLMAALGLGGVSAAPLAASGITGVVRDRTPSPFRAPPQNLVGMQVGPFTMLDEGIERALDLIQSSAAVDTIFPYTHAYGGSVNKGLENLATDHGVPPRDQSKRNLPNVWVRHNEQYFRETTLRHPRELGNSAFDYHDRDFFRELMKPLRARGMKVYARILEAGPRNITNYNTVRTINVNGQPTGSACRANPNYRAFYAATVEDLFRSYEFDGFQWGGERASPLAEIIAGRFPQAAGVNQATCFCEYCIARGKAAGIDVERARRGFRELATYVVNLRGGQARPADGILMGFFRKLAQFPEVLAWEYQYRLAREEMMKLMHDTIKRIKPSAPVGWHVDHWATSHDIISRLMMSYADMAPHSDYLKVVVYHAVFPGRMRAWSDLAQQSVLNDFTPDRAYQLHLDLLGYDSSIANPEDFAVDYVRRETRRSVQSAEGRTAICPGIGFNVSQQPRDLPETVYRATLAAYEAGASGVVACREYEEMTVPNMTAFGRAVRQVAATRRS